MQKPVPKPAQSSAILIVAVGKARSRIDFIEATNDWQQGKTNAWMALYENENMNMKNCKYEHYNESERDEILASIQNKETTSINQ